MDFKNMLVMVGPSGVECIHSIKKIDKSTGKVSIPNNHWCVSSDGVYVARGAEYTIDFDVESGEIPRLITIGKNGVEELTVTKNITESEFSVADISDVIIAMSPER